MWNGGLSNPMDISIIILNYKSKGLLKQCLKGLKLLSFRFSHEIIVLDNNSQDGTDVMMRVEFPDIIFFENVENRGFAAGMNVGIRHAQGNYILMLNPDIAVLGNPIERMLEFMEQHPNVGICGPKLLNPDGTVQTSCREFQTFSTILYRRTPLGKLPFARKRLRKFLMLDWSHSENRAVDWLLGACMMVRRSAVEKVGLLDERFFLYFEDMDWCRRFWQAGYAVYYLGAVAEIVHYHRRQSAESPGLSGLLSYPTRLHLASALKYFGKYLFVKCPNSEYAFSKKESKP